MEKDYWANVHSDVPIPTNAPRGFFKLFVEDYKRNEVWNKIIHLTRDCRLGYMSAVSPDAMTEGDYAGHFCICVHTCPANDMQDRARVLQTLTRAGFYHYIQSYQFNEKNPETEKFLENFDFNDDLVVYY